jgi:hypothetical protein
MKETAQNKKQAVQWGQAYEFGDIPPILGALQQIKGRLFTLTASSFIKDEKLNIALTL